MFPLLFLGNYHGGGGHNKHRGVQGAGWKRN